MFGFDGWEFKVVCLVLCVFVVMVVLLVVGFLLVIVSVDLVLVFFGMEIC